MKILHIDASPLGSASVSRQLTASVVEKLTRDHPSAQVVHRDLGENDAIPSVGLVHADGKQNPCTGP